MSYCLNPNCQKPQNPTGTKYCQNCGTKLLLKQHYRALNIIGQGGFGRTFLAVDEDEPGQPRCVIKQLFLQAQDPIKTQKAAELFEQEAASLGELGKHPQIPQLLDYLMQEGQQYLVQEFIDGQNLAQVLAAEGTYTEAQIRDLLNSLLPVIEFIHAHQIIHRDIKPENIIRRRDGQLFLVDFGAAKLVISNNAKKLGTVIGSAGYAAPEQAGGKAIFSSDLYSLGVTCVHLLTQVAPFDLYSFSEAKWIWRDYLKTFISKKFGKVLDKMLETAISQRYQNATEVWQDLQQAAIIKSPPIAELSIQVLSQNWRCINTFKRANNAIALNPNGQNFASGSKDNTIGLWKLNTGEKIRTLWDHTNAVIALAISPDGEMMASASEDNIIKLWQLSTGQELATLRGHNDRICSLAFSWDGQVLASGSDDQSIKLWQLSTKREFRTIDGWFSGHSDSVLSVAFNPNGQTLASGSADKTIKIWQVNSCKELRSFTGHSNWVQAITFSPDGQILASGSADKTIKIWQVSTGWALHNLTGHRAAINSVAFSPDGQILASGSADKTIKIWQVETGQELTSLRSHSGTVYFVAFSRDSGVLVSGSNDGTVKIWQCF
ncbi:MAG: WD40 repeat domain-containing serine/threonine-protein kinase [Coleofasciculaceae cyanobacterium]